MFDFRTVRKLTSTGTGAVSVSLVLLAGCVHQEDVTIRPEYAYPQNLVSLCDSTTPITVDNQGIYSTSDWGKSGGTLLLSTQLIPGKPEVHRHFQRVGLMFDADSSLVIKAFDANGHTLESLFAGKDMECSADGELLLQFPSSSYYFWASVGSRDHELALWTNAQGGLVVHNKWKESLVGIVGGTVTGDAWALFEAVSASEQEGPAEQGRRDTPPEPTGCPQLADDYEPVGKVVNADGSLDTRTAAEQFFREEIIGVAPVNRQKTAGTRLSILHEDKGDIVLSLYQGDTVLATRVLEVVAIRCEDNRWRIEGDAQFASAWLLMAASGGAHWEDLTLWRDDNGDLLVAGVFKRRVALFLIPMFDTETLFMVFPIKSLTANW